MSYLKLLLWVEWFDCNYLAPSDGTVRVNSVESVVSWFIAPSGGTVRVKPLESVVSCMHSGRGREGGERERPVCVSVCVRVRTPAGHHDAVTVDSVG